MFRSLGLILAALALFAIAGGHWAMVQGVAWAEMLRDNARRTGSVVTAVEQTFDGQHPCELCRKIAAAKSEEAKTRTRSGKSAPVPEKIAKVDKEKALPIDTFQIGTGEPLVRSTGFAGVGFFVVSRTARPLTPPPRSVAA